MFDITIKMPKNKESINIRINREQRIKDTMLILAEVGMVSIQEVQNSTHLYSERNKHFVNMFLTYEQGGIYNGDVLSFGKLNCK
jgi:hypothetical protein